MNDVDQVHIGVRRLRVESVSALQERYSKIDYRLSYSYFWLYHFRILISSKRLMIQLTMASSISWQKKKTKEKKTDSEKQQKKIKERNEK